ncbi:hypothetical protein [Methylopila turkensis]|uniref:Uncharacterized protein n=1 Tax=Methylopila turkensis TaxID=1437816 RepID=A0A9W6N756_9HYPH|nr:hypothetical protein [Methylopila turkensis]GLK80065.1 hypothetical protein GCM10008174_18060 [Methylopila turkensis]
MSATRIVRPFAALALLACAASAALAQGAPSAEGPQRAANPEQSAEIDAKYVAACSAKVPKELCGCVVGVANVHINDIAERQVFYDYMMGEVDKAKAQRAMFSPEKSRTFNVALQKADSLLGQECDKFKPKDAAPPK